MVPGGVDFNEINYDGVVKTLHLLRCYIFYLISTYLSTLKLNKKCAPHGISYEPSPDSSTRFIPSINSIIKSPISAAFISSGESPVVNL